MNNPVRASAPSSVRQATRSSTPARNSGRRWTSRTPSRVLAEIRSPNQVRNPTSMHNRAPAQTPVPFRISARAHLSRPVHIPRMSAQGPTLMSPPVQFPSPAPTQLRAQATPTDLATPPILATPPATPPTQLRPRIQFPPPIQFPSPMQVAAPVRFMAPVQTPSPTQTPLPVQYLNPVRTPVQILPRVGAPAPNQTPLQTQSPSGPRTLSLLQMPSLASQSALHSPTLTQNPTLTRTTVPAPQSELQSQTPSQTLILTQTPVPAPQSRLQDPALTQNMSSARNLVPAPQSEFQSPTLTQSLIPAQTPLLVSAPQPGLVPAHTPIQGLNLVHTPPSTSFGTPALVLNPFAVSALEANQTPTPALQLARDSTPELVKDLAQRPAGKHPLTKALRPAQEHSPLLPPAGTDVPTQKAASPVTFQKPQPASKAASTPRQQTNVKGLSFPPAFDNPKEEMKDENRITIRVIYCYGFQYALLKKFLEEQFPNHLNFESDISAQATGEFEVFVEGKLVHSKKKGEGFVDDTKLIQIVDTIMEEMKKKW